MSYLGGVEEYDYVMDWALVAQALAGIEAQFPIPPDYATTLLPQLMSDLGIGTEECEKFKTVVKYLSGGYTPLYDVAFDQYFATVLNVGLNRTTAPGRFLVNGTLFQNTDTYYQLQPEYSADEEAALNASFLRVEADPGARHENGLRDIPTVHGKFKIPVLTLHTMEIYVPLMNEQYYAMKAAEQGNSDLLVQRLIRDTGHCGFTVPERETAFAALINWVENGAKPAGNNIFDLSDPSCGCEFTQGLRSYDPGCP